MTPEQWIEAERDRSDLEWLARRITAHADRCEERGEAEALSALRHVVEILRAEVARPVPTPAQKKAAAARRASARSSWRHDTYRVGRGST